MAPAIALTAFYWSDTRIRSRSVSATVIVGTIALPTLPPSLVADWNRDLSQHAAMTPGDVEGLSLARTRMRWPDYKHCIQAALSWTQTLGMGELLAVCDVALMACRGARRHHDGNQYGDKVFCNLFLTEDKQLDLHFPSTGERIPLERGTIVIFDTCQPHAVIDRSNAEFNVDDFPEHRDCAQVFLTWELPLEDSRIARLLQIDFDTAPHTAKTLDAAQVWQNGTQI